MRSVLAVTCSAAHILSSPVTVSVLLATAWVVLPICFSHEGIYSIVPDLYKGRWVVVLSSGFVWGYIPRSIRTPGRKGVNALERPHCRLLVVWGVGVGGCLLFSFNLWYCTKLFPWFRNFKLVPWLWDNKTNSSCRVAKINKACPLLLEYVQNSHFSSRKYQHI